MNYVFSFTVEGSGAFPDDMLRRDKCYPQSESDSTLMRHRERREIVMERISVDRFWLPTVGRWESFGWRVLKVNRHG